MPSNSLSLVGFSGSLRKGSFNTTVFEEIARVMPDGVTLERLEFADVPLYNADLDVPPSVEKLKERIGNAAGVLLVSPEYNYGVPGGLKNVIDWLSRPAYQSVFFRKPCSVVTVAPGTVGGARAQAQLRQILGGMASLVFPHPEIAIGSAKTRIENGKLVDESTVTLLTKFASEFVTWVRSIESLT